jgi:hypothetical protein
MISQKRPPAKNRLPRLKKPIMQRSSLEEISISSGTKYIGDYAFEGCSELTNVLLWGRSTKIGKDAFANCPKLENVPH